MSDLATLRDKFLRIRPFLDERAIRLWAANESLALGHGGRTLVARATGLAPSTLVDGRRELQASAEPEPGLERTGRQIRVRRNAVQQN